MTSVFWFLSYFRLFILYFFYSFNLFFKISPIFFRIGAPFLLAAVSGVKKWVAAVLRRRRAPPTMTLTTGCFPFSITTLLFPFSRFQLPHCEINQAW